MDTRRETSPPTGPVDRELPAPPGISLEAWTSAVREATGLGGSVGHGGWIFSTTLGGGRASDRRPCPVCGGTSNCQVSREETITGGTPVPPGTVRAVLCRRVVKKTEGGETGARRECADGVTREAAKGSKSGGKLWVPVVGGARVLLNPRARDEVERLARIVASVAVAKLEVAWRDYARVTRGRGGGKNDASVAAYLAGRGIDVARLPGGCVPMPLRLARPAPDLYEFHGVNKDGTPRADLLLDPATRRPRPASEFEPRRVWKPGAMIAAVVDPVAIMSAGRELAAGTDVGRPAWFRGLHVTYLVREGAKVRKRSAERDERGRVEGTPRREFGACDGVIMFAGEGATKQRMCPGGVLIVAEGIETTLSVMSAAGGGRGRFTCWAATDLGEIAHVPAMVEQLIACGQEISLVVFAVDLDKTASEKKESRTRAGQRGVAAAIEMMREVAPGVTAIAAVMAAADFPTLVSEHEVGREEAAELGVGVIGWGGEADGMLLEQRPAIDGGRKGVDWNDAVRVEGGLEAAETYFSRLLSDDAIAGAGWQFSVWKAGREHADPVEPPRATSPAETLSPRPNVKSEQRRERVRAVRTPPAADEASSRGEGESDAAADADAGGGGGEGGGGYPGLCWVDESEPHKRCISQRGIDRARYWLISEQLVEAERRFRVVWWASRFWLYDDGKWRVMVEEQMRGLIAPWLARFWNRQERGQTVKFVRVDPNERAVTEVLAKVAQECGVWGDTCERAPFWLPENVQGHGEGSVRFGGFPRPWRAPSDRASAAGEAADYVGHKNGLLRLSEMIDLSRKGNNGDLAEPLREYAHTPDLFTQSTVEYEISIDDLALACHAGWDDGAFRHLCPTFMGWLDAATANDTPEEAARRRQQLGEMVGETLSGNRDAEIVYLVPGPPRSGKGVLEAALTAVIGLDRLQATDFAALGSNFGIADLVGKSCAIMSDAHVTKNTDAGLAVERLKTMSGNGRIRVEAKHKEAVTLKINPRIWIMCNDEPDKLHDNSGALAGRFVVWPMMETFKGREDPGVKHGVAKEAAGIAVWALSHYARMRAEGRVRPTMSETAKARATEIARATSKMAAWVQECVIVDASIGCAIDDVERKPGRLSVKMSLAYQVYWWWCRETGVEPVATNRFRSQLRSIVPRLGDAQPKIGDGSRERQYVGITLRADVPEAWLNTPVPIKGAAKVASVPASAASAGGAPPEEQIPF